LSCPTIEGEIAIKTSTAEDDDAKDEAAAATRALAKRLARKDYAAIKKTPKRCKS